MVYGVLVIVLWNVVESLFIVYGINGFIVNNVEEFVEYMIRLYSDCELCC